MRRTTQTTHEKVGGFGTGARDGTLTVTGMVAAIPSLAIVAASLPLVSVAVIAGIVIGVLVS